MAKSKRTWEKTLILFACMGLVERFIPTVQTADTPYERQAAAYAVQNGHKHATAFYRIPAYSARQLAYIEGKARRWIERKGNFEDFSKTTVIDVFGSAVANRVYQDVRRKPQRVQMQEEWLCAMLDALLNTNGYTNKWQLIAAAAEDQDEQKALERVWKRCSKRILKEVRAVHRCPRDAEKERFRLSGGGWIIVRQIDE